MNHATALFMLVVMGSLWGLQFAMLKLAAAGGYSDLAVLMIALVLLSVIFVVISLIEGRPFPKRRDVVVFLTVASALGYVLPLMAVLYAADKLPAGLLTLFGCMAPIVAIMVAIAVRAERVTRRRIFAAVLGIVAVGMVLVPELEQPNWGNLPWMLIAMIVPITYGVESVYLAVKWPEGLTPLQAVTGESVVAGLMVAPIVILAGTEWPEAITWGNAEIGILVFVLAGVIESLMYFFLIRRTGGVLPNFGTFISLFAGILWGIILFDEVHNTIVWVAVGLLAIAVYQAAKDQVVEAKPSSTSVVD